MAIEMNFDEFSSMINNVIAGIIFLEYENKKLTPIFVNDGFFRMLGYSRAEGMNYLKNIKLNIIPIDMPIFEQGIEDALKDDGAVEIEFRTVSADGGLRWLQVRGNLYAREGEKYTILAIVQDITEKKSVEEELNQQAERLHILLNSEGDRIIDYNAKTDVLVIKSSGEFDSSGEKIMSRYMQQFEEDSLYLDDNIYIDDRERYVEVWNRLLRSPGHDIIEVRTKRFDDEFIWYQLNLTSLLGVEGYVTRVVGRLINIHEKKLEEINLHLRARRDVLTKMHEKDAAIELIQNALREKSVDSELSALMILDLDNFKKVYDLLGQAQCDKILAEAGVYLEEVTKGSDVVGRIDIDKFVIYIRDIYSFSDAQKLANGIVERINFTLPHESGDIHVTCSVGMAMQPYHGRTYEELYEKADRAISRVKNIGKCGYRIYDEAATMAYHALRRSNKLPYNPDKDMNVGWNIEDMVMQVLFEDKVLEAALKSAIELITVHYNFHRGLICGSENGNIPLSRQVQFDVHKYLMGLEKQEHFELRRVVYEVLYESFKNCTVIHEYDITIDELRYYFQSEGIKSMLYYPITSKGKFQGAIIFENHEDVQLEFEDHVMEEIRSLFRILEAHVLQIGLMDRLEDFATQIDVLDNLDSYAYVVNADTYELGFVNRRVLMQTPGVKIGDACYKAIQDRDTPCEKCILKQLNREDRHDRCTEEMFNYSLRSWCKCSAGWLDAKEENALAMINCIDISEYFIG